MIRSMSAAVTGLRGHQQKLDVVGNNIANVNTTGFKKSQARFEDLISQTIQGATGPMEERGGINPSQIGLGMAVSSITDIHTQGSITDTDRETDLAIEGEGYFVVTDGEMEYFTRDGSFGVDQNGHIVNDNGLRLLDVDGNEINIPVDDDMVAQATENKRFAGNLDARAFTEATPGQAIGAAELAEVGNGYLLGAEDDVISSLEGHDDDLEVEFTIDGDEQTMTIEEDDLGEIQTQDQLLAALNYGQFTDDEGELIEIDGWDGLEELGARASFDDEDHLLITSLSEGEGSVVEVDGDEDDVEALFGTGDDRVVRSGDDVEKLVDLEDDLEFDVVVDGGDAQTITVDMDGITTREALLEALNEELDGATAEFDDGDNLVISSDTRGPESSVELDADDDNVAFQTLFGEEGEWNETTGEVDEHTFPYYVHDSLGRRYDIDYNFRPVDDNVWEYQMEVTDEAGNLIEVDEGAEGTLVFDENGGLNEDASDMPNLVFDPPGEAAVVNVEPDFSSVTQLAGSNNLLVRDQDGYEAGELAAFDIDRAGVVAGTYTNGMRQEFGQIGMATFSNPEGLRKEGGNLFLDTDNSGDPQIGAPGEGGRGLVQSSALELSNTDLSYEFTELITTSRAFQANTRVVTTSDEVLTEVVNMKR